MSERTCPTAMFYDGKPVITCQLGRLESELAQCREELAKVKEQGLSKVEIALHHEKVWKERDSLTAELVNEKVKHANTYEALTAENRRLKSLVEAIEQACDQKDPTSVACGVEFLLKQYNGDGPSRD